MAEIKPFRGLRYNEQNAGGIGKLVAPPYDVVTQEERDELVSSCPFNIFALELPGGPECSSDQDEYSCSGRLLQDWKREHILDVDAKPSIYPYELEFHLPDAPEIRHVRRGVIAAVRAEEWGNRVILPHEKTFDRVTGDRFRLLEATMTQFSPIFMLYRHNSATEQLFDFDGRRQLFSTTDALGNIHTLYQIDDLDVIQTFCSVFETIPLYIADGHHRYTTALRFSRKMKERAGAEASERFDYVMTYLTDVEDTGMIVLPTHRILTRGTVDMAACRDSVETLFNVTQLDVDGAKPSDIALKIRYILEKDSLLPLFGCIHDRCRKVEIWQVRAGYESLLDEYNRKAELASLDVVVLNDIVFKQMGLDVHSLEAGVDIRYEADAASGMAGLEDGEIMFMMRPTPPMQVLDVADAGLVMPHKSTFFYPKILSGLVLNDMSQ